LIDKVKDNDIFHKTKFWRISGAASLNFYTR